MPAQQAVLTSSYLLVVLVVTLVTLRMTEPTGGRERGGPEAGGVSKYAIDAGVRPRLGAVGCISWVLVCLCWRAREFREFQHQQQKTVLPTHTFCTATENDSICLGGAPLMIAGS